MKLLGIPSNLVDWQLEHTPTGTYVWQSRHIENMLSNHNLTHINSVLTPFFNIIWSISSQTRKVTVISYRSPYIPLFDWNSLLSWFQHTSEHIFCSDYFVRQVYDLSSRHLTLAKRLARYISANCNQEIVFFSSSRTSMKAYIDSDWAGCHESSRSTTGTIITVNNEPVF